MSNEQSMQPAPSMSEVVGGIADDLNNRLSSGDVAQLRRARYDEPPIAFAKLVARRLIPARMLPIGGNRRALASRRWVCIVACMAMMGEFHVPGRKLGRVMAAAGISEQRLTRLLASEGDRLLDEVRAVAKILVSRAEPVDWTDIAWLVISESTSAHQSVRESIAIDYFNTADTQEPAQ